MATPMPHRIRGSGRVGKEEYSGAQKRSTEDNFHRRSPPPSVSYESKERQKAFPGALTSNTEKSKIIQFITFFGIFRDVYGNNCKVMVRNMPLERSCFLRLQCARYK